MMYEALIQEIRGVAVETGSLVCLGCGHEHSCSTRGCAILRRAADALERLCGEAENRPLTAEELRGMDGEPVWVENRTHSKDSGYYLVNLAYEQYFDRPDCVSEVLMSKSGCFFMMNNVGMGLTVYAHKPEQE